jgi:hypothetical protein
VPPGTAGMAPELALTYSSQSANGLLGVGWSLSGLASIGRCPQTFAQDGVRVGITFTNSDRFCLDGQRLIAINGAYGADGAEFRTEMEGFTRIISHGTAGAGPAWFEVHTKSGQIMEFGHTTDSRVLAQGKTTARNWAVNMVTDTKGNYFNVTYTNDTTNGQAYPIEIDYTGNAAAGLSPYNKVQFIYATRPDITPTYVAGSLSRTTVRLTDVKTYAGASLVADYKLSYQQSAATQNSQVLSINECAGDGSCLVATNLTWTNASISSFTTNNPTGFPSYRAWVADFNGDGKADIFWCNTIYWGGCVGTSQVWISNGDGTFTKTTLNNPDSSNGYNIILGDFNGDGKTDIIWCNAHSNNTCAAGPSAPWYLWTSNGDGTFQSQSLPNGFDTALGFAGDFNGDGRTDVLWCTTVYWGGCLGTSQVWISNGDGTFARKTQNNPDTSNGYNIVLGDFNGDGKTDIIWCSAHSNNTCAAGPSAPWYLWTSNGDGTFQSQTVASGFDTAFGFAGDFNGDGRTDVLWCTTVYWGGCLGTSQVWISNGDGTFTGRPKITLTRPMATTLS